jgi:hypothetical protein
MGILSSLFGIGGTGKQATTTQVIQSQIPKELSPFVKQILSESQALYDADIKRGYDPYTALTTAPFTAEQLQAQEDIKGLRGTQAPFIQEALGIQREGAEKFTPEVAQEYMSPYQRAVTDIEKREAQTAFERTARPAFEKRAVDAGGMSGLGTRAGVESAEMQRGQSRLLADIEAKGLQSSFLNAQQQFAQQKAREQQMASNIGRTGPALFGATLAEAGAAEGVGAERRQLAQTGLDEAYFKFLEEQQFPQRTLSQYSGSVYANPMLGTPTRTSTTTGTPFQPSMGQNLLGLGLTGLNIYGMGGGAALGGTGFTAGNAFQNIAGGGQKLKGFLKGGGSVGGLSGLPVVRRQAGTYGRADSSGAIQRPRARMPVDFEEENIDINFPYTRPPDTRLPEGRGRRPISFADKVKTLYESFGVRPTDIEAAQKRQQKYTSERAEKTQEFETGQEAARAKRFERRMARAKEGNPMARFAAIQKAIQAGVMGEQGIDIVKGMEVFGEEMAPLNQKMSDLMNTIEEEDEATKAGQREKKHERVINALKTNEEFQEKLLAVPRKDMLEFLATLQSIGTIEKLGADIDGVYLKHQDRQVANEMKKLTYELNLDKALTDKIKVALSNVDLIGVETDIYKVASEALFSNSEIKNSLSKEVIRTIAERAAKLLGVDPNSTGPIRQVPAHIRRRSQNQNLSPRVRRSKKDAIVEIE